MQPPATTTKLHIKERLSPSYHFAQGEESVESSSSEWQGSSSSECRQLGRCLSRTFSLDNHGDGILLVHDSFSFVFFASDMPGSPARRPKRHHVGALRQLSCLCVVSVVPFYFCKLTFQSLQCRRGAAWSPYRGGERLEF